MSAKMSVSCISLCQDLCIRILSTKRSFTCIPRALRNCPPKHPQTQVPKTQPFSGIREDIFYVHGLQTVTKDSQGEIKIVGDMSLAVCSHEAWTRKTSQRVLYTGMPPLVLIEISYASHSSESALFFPLQAHATGKSQSPMKLQ